MNTDANVPVAAWITTGQRPAFARNLEAFLELFTRYHTIVPVLLGIDGYDSGLDNALAQISHRFPDFSWHVSDTASRVAFVDTLPADFDHSVVRDALVRREGFPYSGANRNSVLLACAGRPVIVTDDDITPETAVLSPGINVDGISFMVLPSMAAVLSSIQPVAIDIIGTHLNELRAPDVRLCTFGFYGITGSTVNRGVLTLEGSDRERFMDHGYAGLRDSPFTVRIPRTSSSTPGTFLMASHTSYDATGILPPFFTAGRNDDGLFAHMVRLCYPASKTAYSAYGLYHNPQSHRSYSEETRTGFSLTLSELFMLLTAWASRRLASFDPAERMQNIGTLLCKISGLSADMLTDQIREIALPSVINYRQKLENLLDIYGREPTEWARDVDRLLENLRTFEREPSRLYGPDGCGLSVSGVQDELWRYGSLLQCWPALWDLACVRNREAPCTARTV